MTRPQPRLTMRARWRDTSGRCPWGEITDAVPIGLTIRGIAADVHAAQLGNASIGRSASMAGPCGRLRRDRTSTAIADALPVDAAIDAAASSHAFSDRPRHDVGTDLRQCRRRSGWAAGAAGTSRLAVEPNRSSTCGPNSSMRPLRQLHGRGRRGTAAQPPVRQDRRGNIERVVQSLFVHASG